MSNKSWRAKVAAKQGPPVPKPITATVVRESIDADIRLELMQQAAIMEQLIHNHHGDVPVSKLWEMRAMRLTQTGAGLARS